MRINLNNPKKILFAPLDWGLGHASRCIPLIKECLALGHQVIIAGNHTVSALLRPEFPQLQFLELKGYEVKYAKQKWALPFLMMKQIPSILSVIRFERKWLDNVVTEWAMRYSDFR
ncbi:hypothetical protein EMGBS15_05780 [Filimonas sp.]|nr:hypothetical protein EMGBS15_05780 [Filimonas sp.]